MKIVTKHQKTLRAINRANHKQAQNLAKRAKRLDCKLTISVVFVSKNNIVVLPALFTK